RGLPHNHPRSHKHNIRLCKSRTFWIARSRAMENATPQTSTERPANKHWFFWFTAVAGIFLIAFFVFAGLMTFKYFKLDKYGYSIPIRANGIYVATVEGAGPANGKLQAGDKILAVNDDARSSRVPPFGYLQSLPEGQSYNLQIERVGSEQQIELSTAEF